MMTSAQIKAYQEAFQTFVTKRKLDIEYDNWSPKDTHDWESEVRVLQKSGVLPR